MLSTYPNIGSSHWLKADVQRTINKVFKGKSFGLMGFDTFSHFSTELFDFACNCYCFQSHKTYSDVLLMTEERQTTLSSHPGVTYRFIDFR